MSGQKSMSSGATKKKSETKHRGGNTEPTPKRHATLDDQLEQGLEESFPGSDPVAVTQPPAQALRHKPELARKGVDASPIPLIECIISQNQSGKFPTQKGNITQHFLRRPTR